MQKNKDLLSVEQAAQYIGVHRVTLFKWLREGIAPPRIKIGKRKKFRLVDLDKYKNEGIK
jgi:excisionase family DNA binding protein